MVTKPGTLEDVRQTTRTAAAFERRPGGTWHRWNWL